MIILSSIKISPKIDGYLISSSILYLVFILSSLKSRFFKSIFTIGFEENPFSTTILESILKKSEKNRAFSIDKLLFDPKKFNSPEINFGRILSSRFKSCLSSLNLTYESLKFLKEKSSFKYKSKSPSKY